MTQVQFQVDGQPVTLTSYVYGISRSDVCNAFAELEDPNCPYIGYQGWLDTTAFANGTHVLSVIATDGVIVESTYDRTFRILN